MALILTVLQIVAPIGVLALAGFVWARAGFDYPLEFVTRLVMNLALPALIFTALMKTTIAPQALTTLTLASITAYGLLSLIFLLLARVMRLDRRTYVAPLIFGNTGNIGLPLALFAFGEAGLGYGVVVFAVMMVWSFTFGLWLVTGGGAPRRVLSEPSMWATLLGALFLWQGWQTPDWLTRALELLGQMAIPLMLITLGVAMTRLTVARIGQAVGLSVLRLVLCAGLAVTVGWGFGLPPTAFAVLVLQLTTPVAVTAYMLAGKHGADADVVAGLVFASTLISVGTLPLALAFLI